MCYHLSMCCYHIVTFSISLKIHKMILFSFKFCSPCPWSFIICLKKPFVRRNLLDWIMLSLINALLSHYHFSLFTRNLEDTRDGSIHEVFLIVNKIFARLSFFGALRWVFIQFCFILWLFFSFSLFNSFNFSFIWL